MDLEHEGWVNIPYDHRLLEEFYDGVDDESFFEKQFDHKEEIKEVMKSPILIKESKDSLFDENGSNQDPIFQDFFKKENQFVEMNTGSRGESDTCDEKNGDHVINCSSSIPSKKIEKEVVAWKASNDERLNFWKVGVHGIGVLCSLGMAAATICIVMCGNGRRNKQHNHNLKFEIYGDNKRIKQVVEKANEAMSAVRMRGVPNNLVNAQITYGGYHETH